MSFPSIPPISRSTILFALPLVGLAAPSFAHEAWLLTPAEIEALSREPLPHIFRSSPVLFAAAAAGTLVTSVALWTEDRFGAVERRVAGLVLPFAATMGALVLRLGLAAMLVLAATGGLPRHGTAPWTQPTLLVPDMQLSLVPGWDWLVVGQMMLGVMLAIGFGTRLAGLALIGLSLAGLGLFGGTFLSYAPHFAAPGLMLAIMGGGSLSVDRLLEDRDPVEEPSFAACALWRLAQIVVGLGFVYLAVAYKLTQPTLLIAILDHGNFPTFGLPLAWIALAMTGIEIVCGTLLALGRLIRPVSLILIGAISFLAFTLGETPLFHANLYGIMLIFAMAGRSVPVRSARVATILRRVEA